ncbi:MAG: TonB-dependent receptor, partial [Tannerellaceae bacterium]|nr:TonB-dependent receptor [Tannerellaceae bacterium]
EIHSTERNMPVQNWYCEVNDGFEQNPYWLIYRSPNTDKRARVLTTLAATLEISEHFSIQARGNIDYIHDKYQQKIYASTSPSIAGQNGRYIDYTYQETLLYGDLMAIYTNRWDKFSLNAVLGTSISDNRVSSLRIDSKTASLYFPNVFTVSNIKMSSNAFIDEKDDNRRQIQSVYATTQLGYNEIIFVDITARNDWSSTLAFTESKNKGYFYPSVGTSYILTEQFVFPESVNFGKFRASWSQVGNDIPLYVSNSVAHIGAGGAPQPNDTAPFDKLKPERSNSFEIGTEWKFFNYRLDFDLTLYRTNTRNQLFKLPSLAGAAYKYYYVNAGNIQNQGIELSITGVPFINQTIKWQSSLNLSANQNRIKKLHDQLPSFIPGDEGFSSSYTMRWVKGGSFGDIYGKAFDRYEAGNIKYGDDNLPMIAGAGNTIKVGNCNPKLLAGWSNAIRYKNVSLYFLIDGRFGGEVLSQTQAVLDERGVSKVSGQARERGYIDLEGFRIENVQGFYEKIGGRDGVTEYYMYSGTTVRLREASLTYHIPIGALKTDFIKEAQIALTGRNIGFLYKKAPFDPEMILSTENNNQGVDAFGTPSTRSTAINVRLTF